MKKLLAISNFILIGNSSCDNPTESKSDPLLYT